MKKVFLDFGHGGKDSGAIGNGLLEKDVVLSIGTKVKKHLERCNLQVNTSRNTDKTVSLEERCKLANNLGSNCFISIHCNSAEEENAKGLEVFSSTPKTTDLATILYNQLIEDNLYNTKRGVKNELFYVLKHTKMRAALIELAFLSNAEDSKLLKNKQNEFAESIAKGICKYLDIEYKNSRRKKYKNCILYANNVDRVGAEIISWAKEDCIIKNVKDHIPWKATNLFVVGGPAKIQLDKMQTKENYTEIVGKNRYDTIRKCLDLAQK